MTDGEKAEAYFEKMKDEKIPFTITNVNNAIKQAYIDGIVEGRKEYNNLTVSHEKQYDLLREERDSLLKQNKELQEIVDALHKVLEDAKDSMSKLLGEL